MDQVKIGKFIQELRKEKNLTQMDLANKLNITDRAISKWENGKSLPDSSIMLELCNILGITVTELLLGGKIEMENYNKKTESKLLEILKQQELSNKRLLLMEVVMMVISVIFLLSLFLIGILIYNNDKSKLWVFLTLFGIGLVQFFICAFFSVRIEQVAGYYECKHCGDRHIPTFVQVNFACHMGRTRYMKCPKCNKRSWQHKVLSDKEE